MNSSFDLYRQQTDEHIASLTPITSEIETQTIEYTLRLISSSIRIFSFFSFSLNENPNIHRTTELDDSDSNSWFDASPDIIDKQQIEHELENLSSPLLSTETEMKNLKAKIQQITLEYPTYFPLSNEDPFENLNQLTSLLKNLQNEIKDLQRYERDMNTQQ